MKKEKIKEKLISFGYILAGFMIGAIISITLSYGAGNQGLIGSAFECLDGNCNQLVLQSGAFADKTIELAKFTQPLQDLINGKANTSDVTSSINLKADKTGTYAGMTVGNSTNSTNSAKLNNQDASFYQNASNINGGTLDINRLPSITKDKISSVNAGVLSGSIPTTVTYNGKTIATTDQIPASTADGQIFSYNETNSSTSCSGCSCNPPAPPTITCLAGYNSTTIYDKIIQTAARSTCTRWRIVLGVCRQKVSW